MLLAVNQNVHRINPVQVLALNISSTLTFIMNLAYAKSLQYICVCDEFIDRSFSVLILRDVIEVEFFTASVKMFSFNESC